MEDVNLGVGSGVMEDAMAEVFSWGHDPKGVKGKLSVLEQSRADQAGWVDPAVRGGFL